MNFVIRDATLEDLEAIILLASQLYETEQPFDDNVKDNYYKTEQGINDLKEGIKNCNYIFLVCTNKNDIVGFVDGYIIDDKGMFKERVAYLNRLVVTRDMRDKGIGNKLIDEFTSIVKKNNCRFIKLNAFRHNDPAVNLYMKKGFYEYSVFYMKEID